MNRRAPLPLPELLAMNRNAVTVYAALRSLAGERRQLFTTRRTIRELCGLSEDTISGAMTALGKAGWMCVNYGRQGRRTWYRLTFPVPGFFPVPAKRRHREGTRDPKKAAQGTVPCTPKNGAQSQGGLGAVPAAAPNARPEHGAASPAPTSAQDEEATVNLADYLCGEAEP